MLLLFLSALPVQAAGLDAEVNKPYRLEVVLRVAKNRTFTEVYRDRIRRELRDSLQASFGNLAQVEVVDEQALSKESDQQIAKERAAEIQRTLALLKKVEADGLQKALDAAVEDSDRKVHFVLVDYHDNQYEVRSRQLDGVTGRASPVVRMARTPDREFVPRIIGLLIDRDFGLTGTVEKIDQQTAKVTFKGSGLAGSLEKYVKKDEVLAISGIVKAGGKLQPKRVESALLQVDEEPKNGVCKCKVWFRYGDPLAAGATVVGYRCLKLGTGRGPLRLRLVDRKDVPHLDLSVRIGRYGFDKDDVREQLGANSDGLLQSKQPYQHVAFVRVMSGGASLATMPIEIYEDAVTTIQVEVTEGAELLGALEIRRQRWRELVYETLLVQKDLRIELNDLAARSLLPQALERAQRGLEALKNDLENRGKELAALKEEAKGLPKNFRFTFTDADQRMKELERARDDLQSYVKNVAAAIERENDPKRIQAIALVEQARLLEGQADYAEAVKQYQESLKLFDDQPETKKRIAELKRLLAPKNAAHRAAQEFILKRWASAENAQMMSDLLKEAAEALAVCKKEKDKLTVEKLVVLCTAITIKLQEQQKSLRLKDSEDDRKTNELIIKVNDDLKELLKDALDFLGANEK